MVCGDRKMVPAQLLVVVCTVWMWQFSLHEEHKVLCGLPIRTASTHKIYIVVH